ncbi:MAG: hypothetical protein ACRCU5_13830 [Rhizobiaceae bacterium]
MSKIIAFPFIQIDQHVSEAQSLARLLISIGENAEDHEYARLRPHLVTSLYVLCDKLETALSNPAVRKGA